MRTLSFLFAAALGATLGAFTALEIAPLIGLKEGLAATLGIIIGGLVGYITVDFRQFCEGVVCAFKVAFSLPKKIFHAFRQCSRKDWLEGASFLGIGLLCMFYMCSVIALVEPDLRPGYFQILAVLAISMSTLLPFAGLIASDYQRDGENLNNSKILYWGSPIGIGHALLLASPLVVTTMQRVFGWLMINVPKAGGWLVRQTGIFFKTLFIAVHSERRVLCCFDAMLGALVGYFFGSWLLGTVAGLVFALVSYEFISKRLLKLQTN